jgi:hypothetical protein
MPLPSPPRKEQGPDTNLIHEQQGPPEEVHEQEGWDKEPLIRKLHPITIRPMFMSMRDVSSMSKWYAHDQFKAENQFKEVPARASKEASPANNNWERSIQMLMPSNGQMIAQKHMKEASPSYQTVTFSAYHLE